MDCNLVVLVIISSVTLAYHVKAAEPVSNKSEEVEVWTYRLIAPRSTHTWTEHGQTKTKHFPATDLGELKVEPKTGRFVYQYWREAVLWHYSVPRARLVGVPGSERPLIMACGFDGQHFWLANFDGRRPPKNAVPIVPRQSRRDITRNVVAAVSWGLQLFSVETRASDSPTVHSWRAVHLVTTDPGDREHWRYWASWLNCAPIHNLLDEIGCPQWDRDALLNSLRATPDVKLLADVSSVERGEGQPARLSIAGRSAVLIRSAVDRIIRLRWESESLFTTLGAQSNVRLAADAPDSVNCREVTQWELTAPGQVFARVPHAGPHVPDQRRHDWKLVVFVDDHELGISRCLIESTIGSIRGAWPHLVPRQFEAVRQDKPQIESSELFTVAFYCDQQTMIEQYAAENQGSRR